MSTKSLFGAILIFVCMVVGMAKPTIADDGVIVVTGTGAAAVNPDIIKFRVQIRTEAESAVVATQKTARKYESVQRALRELDIPKNNCPTVDFKVTPEWKMDGSTGKKIMVGFAADHSITVQVSSNDLLGRAVDSVIKSGASWVGSFKYAYTAYDSLRQVALQEAVHRARKEAEVLADAAGGHLGALLELSTKDAVQAQGGRLRDDFEVFASSSEAPTKILPRDKVVRVTVLQRWQLVMD